jgi:hypothetical protein
MAVEWNKKDCFSYIADSQRHRREFNSPHGFQFSSLHHPGDRGGDGGMKGLRRERERFGLIWFSFV